MIFALSFFSYMVDLIFGMRLLRVADSVVPLILGCLFAFWVSTVVSPPG